MNERIKELAEQAGLLSQDYAWVAHDINIEYFAELVRQDERAKLGKPTLFFNRAVYFADSQTGEVKHAEQKENT